jgi:hypothetical protein
MRPGLVFPAGFDRIFDDMYENFYAVERWSKKKVHCVYQALVVAIATRHADAIDIKFNLDDRGVWIALPHTAWAEYSRRNPGQVITDPLAVQLAGRYLKQLIESGEDNGRDMFIVSETETLTQLEAFFKEARAVPA